jgi:sigma-B regulation protein RsbU (phosphoserine phosphatase)
MMDTEVADLQALYDHAPCGYVVTDLRGTLVQVNQTFEELSGYRREELVGRVRLAELFTRGGRIYYETHYAPLLLMQGSVQAIALELRRADGGAVPILVNSVVHRDPGASARAIFTTVFDATDRRSYESELLAARRRERDIAHYLQRSMLSGRLPTGDGFELAFRYDPAEDGLAIGGDWYDAFWLDERVIGLVVGDVVGRGIEAAAAMGQLRSAVRALAATGLGPSELLSALDVYAHRHTVGETATLIYAQLDVSTGELRFACAGHPPPVLLEAAGEPRLLWQGRSRPLWVDERAQPRPEGQCKLGAGDTIVLYTDGLIEDRARPSEDGLDRLLEAIGERRGEPLGTFVATLAEALAYSSRADDVCLLATRLSA